MDNPKHEIISSLIETIDIPESAYEKAIARAKDLEGWIKDSPDSKSATFAPAISAQGSFRLGTVTRPIAEDDEYDLDLSWLLRSGFDQDVRTQFDLKQLVGLDIENYRQARRIETAREEKNRCWRLRYKDQLKFHLDGVPCLPARSDRKRILETAMGRAGLEQALAKTVSELSVVITDRTRPDYKAAPADWLVSNPEGYAQWFESRMRLAKAVLESRVLESRASSIEDLPAYRWKTPLQRCVQLLKRHRDVMFEALPDRQPVSIIITTLAARAYQGETGIPEAMDRILSTMDQLVGPRSPRVPNPVNPVEDFADKWSTEEGRRLQLEENFHRWLAQAKVDFRKILSSTAPEFIAEQAQARFRASLDVSALQKRIGVGFPNIVPSPKTVPISEPAKPWRR